MSQVMLGALAKTIGRVDTMTLVLSTPVLSTILADKIQNLFDPAKEIDLGHDLLHVS